jgi:hypothetical protein
VASFSSYVKVFTATADHNKNNNKNEINSNGKTVKKVKSEFTVSKKMTTKKKKIQNRMEVTLRKKKQKEIFFHCKSIKKKKSAKPTR